VVFACITQPVMVALDVCSSFCGGGDDGEGSCAKTLTVLASAHANSVDVTYLSIITSPSGEPPGCQSNATRLRPERSTFPATIVNSPFSSTLCARDGLASQGLSEKSARRLCLLTIANPTGATH
jgi:hypothetical protein